MANTVVYLVTENGPEHRLSESQPTKKCPKIEKCLNTLKMQQLQVGEKQCAFYTIYILSTVHFINANAFLTTDKQNKKLN